MQMLSQGAHNGQPMQGNRTMGALQQQIAFANQNLLQQAQFQNQMQTNLSAKSNGKDINAKVDDLMKS